MTVAVVNIEAQNNVPFGFEKILSGWGALYNLATSKFMIQIRDKASNLNYVHEFSTDAGSIVLDAVPAVNFMKFTDNPVAADTLTLGTSTVTFVASGASGNEVNIGATASDTMEALVTMLNASADTEISKCTYERSLDIIVAVFGTNGDDGNAFAFASGSSGISIDGPSLKNGGYMMSVKATTEVIKSLVGAYAYDCVLIDGSLPRVPLFGGTITFAQGVTRL